MWQFWYPTRNQSLKEKVMRVMVIVKASKASEAGVLPSQELLTQMGKFNEELDLAGSVDGRGGGMAQAMSESA
jgi:hypothetical protein